MITELQELDEAYEELINALINVALERPMIYHWRCQFCGGEVHTTDQIELKHRLRDHANCKYAHLT